ncbi:MAG: glucan ABC transporter ATP-binding protein/ permease [Pseudomonadota bacterium]
MNIVTVYKRALSLLSGERWLCAGLVLANAAVGLLQLAEPVFFGWIVDALANSNPTFGLIGLWALLGFFSILASVLVAISADRLAHRQRLAAMANAFEHAITLPLSYHADRGTGTVVRTILAGATSLFGTWLTVMREQIAAITAIVFLAPVAFWMEWRLALLLILLSVFYACLNVLVIRRTSEGQAAVEQYHVDVSGRVGDVVGNITVVQGYSRLAAEADMMRQTMRQLLSEQYPVLTWWGVLTVLNRAAATVTMVAVFGFGSYLASAGEITVGEIVSFAAFASLLIAKLDQLTSFVSRLFMETPTLATYFALLDEQAELKDALDATDLTGIQGTIRFDQVTFRYGAGDQGVFDVSVDIPAGRTVAVVGPTGAGKTTLMALLQRLRDPGEGRILIDGKDIKSVTLQSLRHNFAVVFQDAGLFNRSIAENIAVGRPDATDEEIRQATRLARAESFVAAKPGGMSFVAGERGASLSGGERQRIAIARAILRNAPILILDEATSALDTKTEAEIKAALDTLREGRTTLIIAHRLSTVANADLIVVMDKGRVVETGRYDELVERDGLFASLVKAGDFSVPQADEDNSIPAS